MSAERLLLLAAFAVGASAQDLLTSSSCSGIQALLSDAGAKQTLEGRAELSHASLNYAFRFQAGYSIDIPLRQFAGKGKTVRVIARVRPSDGSRPPVCLFQSGALPDIPEGDKPDLPITGGFFLGEGNYRVDLAVFDQAGRLYQARFNLEAALKGRERKVRLELAPGEVQPINSLRWKPHSESAGRGRRLTILFHAASLYGAPTLPSLYDPALLLSSLSTVLSEVAFDQVRLIAFNLDQERELFRQDRFDVDGFRKLAETLLSLKLSSVPVAALAPGEARHALIDSLVGAEMSSEKPPDAILFLEARIRTTNRSGAVFPVSPVVPARRFSTFSTGSTARLGAASAMNMPEGQKELWACVPSSFRTPSSGWCTPVPARFTESTIPPNWPPRSPNSTQRRRMFRERIWIGIGFHHGSA
jgi:hypothetical protein